MVAMLLKQILALLTEIRDLLKSPPLPAVPYEHAAQRAPAAVMDAPAPAYDPLAGMRRGWLHTPDTGGAVFDGPTAGATVAEAMPPESEPDLDTALTMGMEAPAPVVAPNRKGPASLYPTPSLTPGVIFPQITGDDVSVPGYAKRVRAVPEAMKRAVYLRYGLDPAKHETAEVDHYVSLCLGGTNDVENLWPEPAVTPDAPGQVGFREKDAVEFFLHQQVCNKSMSLQAAQDAIRGDWYATYLSIPHSHLAMMSAMLDAPEQP